MTCIITKFHYYTQICWCVLLQPMPAALMNSSVIMASASTLHGGVMMRQIALTVLMRTKLSAVSFHYLSLSDFCIFLFLLKQTAVPGT